jgi:glycosyltransferase involved in cell wall biosynthesis
VNVAFMLASHRRDAPAGMERAVAGLIDGLERTGHRAIVLSAAEARGDPRIVPIPGLRVRFPSDDQTLRSALDDAPGLEERIEGVLRQHRIDVACYVDALWGLGRLLTRGPARVVLGMHVVGHDIDLRPALDRHPHAVIAPAPGVIAEAACRGYDTSGWKVVPNSLLGHRPGEVAAPTRAAREALRLNAPIRAVARLGPEKGIEALLACIPRLDRPVEIALAAADFEPEPGSQHRLLAACRALARSAGPAVRLVGSLRWEEVRPFLAGASLVMVPSRAESFGLVALEAMSVGTPLAAFAVGNLPALAGGAGAVVPLGDGEAGLWDAAGRLLEDRIAYQAASLTGLRRSRPYDAVTVARQWLEVVCG